MYSQSKVMTYYVSASRSLESCKKLIVNALIIDAQYKQKIKLQLVPVLFSIFYFLQA